MKTIITYMADDGTKFDDEKKCIQHENKTLLREIKADCSIKKENGESISLYDILDKWDDVAFIYVKTDEAAYILNDYLCNGGYESPWDNRETLAGAFYYAPWCNEWISLDEYRTAVKLLEQHIPDGWKF